MSDGAAVTLKALSKLAQAPNGVLSASALRLKPEQVAALSAEQLVVTRPGRRGAVMVEITLAGRERAASAPAPVTRARKAAPDVDARLARIEAMLETLLARSAAAPAAPAARHPDDVKSLVMAAIADLDSTRRYGGLVPIPELRKALGTVAATQVTAALEALEQEYAIDLNVAQQPTTVSDPAAGIERPGRGLLYYVARRGA